MSQTKLCSIYIHIPFCRTRCTYCVFNTYAGLEHLIEDYVQALCKEIQIVGKSVTDRDVLVHTVYFGGGTPNVLSVQNIAQILAAVYSNFATAASVEVTLEANPTVAEGTYFQDLRAAGITRLSLGAQSAQPPDLALFNRRHTWQDVCDTVDAAVSAGFGNVSVDLIYGAPGQALRGWQDTLEKAIALSPSHISLYSMSLEEGAPLTDWVMDGRVSAMDSDLAADMYDYATDVLAEACFEQYEISNWSLAGMACEHNLQYWRREPYLAFGAGGYGFWESLRYGNVDHPRDYIRMLNLASDVCEFPLSPAADVDKLEQISEKVAQGEMVFLGLRMLQEGVSKRRFKERFGVPITALYQAELGHLVQQGMIAELADRYVLTKYARLIANRVFKYFV
jgi:oxygen-independent coproporphyrinogen-3 oxidase